MVTTRSRTSRKAVSGDDLHTQIDGLNDRAVMIFDEYPAQALEICQQNAVLLNQTTYPTGLIRNQLTLALALRFNARSLEAIEVLTELEPLCHAKGDITQMAEFHYYFALIYESLANYGKALLHAEESLLFSQKCGLSEHEAKTQLLLGTISQAIGMADKALEQVFTALELFESMDSSDGISKSLNNIGTIYNDIGEYDRAIEFFQKSLAIKRQLTESRGVANTLNNIANILFWARREYDKAIEYYHESLSLSRAHGYIDLLALSLQYIGQVHVYKQDYEQAIHYSLEGIAITREARNMPDLAYGLMDLGFAYYHAGHIEKSIELVLEGLAIAEAEQADMHIQKGCNLLRQIYKENGDFEKAVEFNERFIELQQRSFDSASNKRIQHLTIQFEVEKTRQEKELYRLRMEKLGQEMEHKSKELTTQAMYLLQKNEFLRKLDQLIEEATPATEKEAVELLYSVQLQIREIIRGEKSWETFEQQFKLVHHDFIGRLSELYPALTPMELKVSALLRMNLSTKEIADLLYQSPRSIESYRYRLRQKMDLPSTTNLATFLTSL